MGNKLFPTYEVGSLPKPNWKVNALAGTPNSDKELKDFKALSQRIGYDPKTTLSLLKKLSKEKRKPNPEERELLHDSTASFYMSLQDSLGLDFVYDGEARRGEMYWNVAKHTDGLEPFPEMIRSRGPDSWRRCMCTHEPTLYSSLDEVITKEVSHVLKHFKKNPEKVKVPIDDPYMIAMMTDESFYRKKLEHLRDKPDEWRYQARRELNLALADEVIKPQVEEAIKEGAKWIQLDAPGATNEVTNIPIFIEGINKVVENMPDDVKFSIHICYPKRKPLMPEEGYALFYGKNKVTGNPHFVDLNPKVDHLSLEFANADNYKADLKPFKDHWNERKFEFGFGVLDITYEQQEKGRIETPELVADRIRYGASLFGPEYIFPAPDCGLRQLSLERSVDLYEILIEGAEIARKG